MAINRVLFDLVNPATQQLTFDKVIRHKVLHYHLVQRTAGKQFQSVLNAGTMHPPTFNFDKVPKSGFKIILAGLFSFKKWIFSFFAWAKFAETEKTAKKY